MYGKLFTQMYDGTLATKGPWQALVTFQQLVILADKNGVVDMTAEAIARRTTIPLEIIQEGITHLLNPDPDSRSPNEEGRRITALSEARNWGWKIVNYEHYRKIRSAEERTEYHRQYYHDKRKPQQTSTLSTDSTNSSKQYAVSKKQEAEEHETPAPAADAAGVRSVTQVPHCPHEKIVALYHEVLPECPRVVKWNEKRQSYLKARWREQAQSNGSGYTTEAEGLAWWRHYFKYVATSEFLTGRTKGSGDKPPFIADLEWLVTPNNFVKVQEAKYHR